MAGIHQNCPRVAIASHMHRNYPSARAGNAFANLRRICDGIRGNTMDLLWAGSTSALRAVFCSSCPTLTQLGPMPP
jgi:hypothetical protein